MKLPAVHADFCRAPPCQLAEDLGTGAVAGEETLRIAGKARHAFDDRQRLHGDTSGRGCPSRWCCPDRPDAIGATSPKRMSTTLSSRCPGRRRLADAPKAPATPAAAETARSSVSVRVRERARLLRHPTHTLVKGGIVMIARLRPRRHGTQMRQRRIGGVSAVPIFDVISGCGDVAALKLDEASVAYVRQNLFFLNTRSISPAVRRPRLWTSRFDHVFGHGLDAVGLPFSASKVPGPARRGGSALRRCPWLQRDLSRRRTTNLTQRCRLSRSRTIVVEARARSAGPGRRARPAGGRGVGSGLRLPPAC